MFGKKKEKGKGKKVKKMLSITMRSKPVVAQMGPLLHAQMYKQFEKQILDGSIIMDEIYNDDESEATFQFLMEGTEKEVNEWSKIRARDKMVLKPFKKWIETKVEDVKE